MIGPIERALRAQPLVRRLCAQHSKSKTHADILGKQFDGGAIARNEAEQWRAPDGTAHVKSIHVGGESLNCAAHKNDRVTIGVVPIDAVTMTDAVERVSNHLASHSQHQFIVTGANAQFVNTAKVDPELASFLRTSDLNVPDGISLLIAARILGAKLPERITGIDLMVELCGLAAQSERTVYLFGGMVGAAKRAASFLQTRYPGLRIVGIDRPPMGREFDPIVVSQARNRIIEVRPDFLFVCLGVPRQEKWIQQFVPGLPVKVVMGNGAAFDVLAGFFHRPPVWIQKIGMEWFYRLCMEPKRLWRRYLLGNILFIEHVLAQGLDRPWRTS